MLHELDGLKDAADRAVAYRARMASEFLQDGFARGVPWLHGQPPGDAVAAVADGGTHAERVLRCCSTYASARTAAGVRGVLLFTSDSALASQAARLGTAPNGELRAARPLEWVAARPADAVAAASCTCTRG